MVRAAALVSGDGARLQAILDSMYFKEIPDFELVAVISTARDVYAMKRALNAGVPAYVVFSNATLADMAAKRPADMVDFMDVSGVGEYKAARYGRAFLEVIRNWESKKYSVGDD